MRKIEYAIWILCSTGVALSCASLGNVPPKAVSPPVVTVKESPPAGKETIVTLAKIADGYEIIVAVVDKEKADVLPLSPGEIAKRIFCHNEKAFPPENVIVVPEDDPALDAFTQQFAHSSRGAFVKAEIIDKESHAVQITSKDSSSKIYIRLLLAKRKVPKLVKDSTY